MSRCAGQCSGTQSRDSLQPSVPSRWRRQLATEECNWLGGDGPRHGEDVMRMRARVWSVVDGLVLIALGVWLAWFEGLLLLRDFGVSANMEAASKARLVKGRCRSRIIVFFCDLTIDQNLAGAPHQIE